MAVRFSAAEFAKLKRILLVYDWGYRTLLTKFTILHEDFANFHDSNPIDHIRGRMKAPESIANKLDQLGHAITAKNAQKHVGDIAGIRIICPFARDIYHLVDLIEKMPGIEIVGAKDYVQKPKASGYRSYHLQIAIPVFYSGQNETVEIEVQIRTEAMNFWATLEHEARYKYQSDVPEHLSNELVVCADKIAELDHRMFLIHENIMGHSDEITVQLTDDALQLEKEKTRNIRMRSMRRRLRKK